MAAEIREPAAKFSPQALAVQASADSCAGSEFHDSGYIVYVLAPRDCAPVDGSSVLLKWGNDRGSKTIELPFTAFGDEATVEFEAGHSRIVSAHRRGSWRSFPNTDSWVHRDGAGLLVLNGEMYLLGGWPWSPVGSSEVWKSRDAIHWEFLGNAPWPGRHGAGWLVHDQQLWVIGGDLADDVWSSPDGINWTKKASNAPFGKRYTPSAASIGGRIVVFAGQSWETGTDCEVCVAVAPRDVWTSIDGRQWDLATAEAPWKGRGLIHGSAVFDGEIFLIGGGLKARPPDAIYAVTVDEERDIWSSRDGGNWTKRSQAFSFEPRTHFSVVSTPKGCYVSDGSVGTQVNVVNELHFASDCINFAPVPDSPPLQPRHASSLAYLNGSLVILGGPPIGDAGTTVWQYFP